MDTVVAMVMDIGHMVLRMAMDTDHQSLLLRPSMDLQSLVDMDAVMATVMETGTGQATVMSNQASA